MASDKQLAYLEQLVNQHPALADDLNALAGLYERKLWHQLTLKLEEVSAKLEFQQGDLLVQLYNGFVEAFALKLNGLKLAMYAVVASKQFADAKDGVAFLEKVIKKFEDSKGMMHELSRRTEQPVLALQMRIAQYKLSLGEMAECKKVVEAGRELLESLTDVDPTVSSSVYYVSSLYHKAEKDFVGYYRASLLYLAYVSSDSLPADFRLATAVDISLAALLGDSIYNFGELLLHPIIHVLDGTEYEWLHTLLQIFHDGDMHAYDDFCAKNASVLNAQPALVQNERKLREKITILSLTQLIFSLPAENRTISLETIAQRTKLNVDGVEFLLMKALSLHLIEGVMDQVDGNIQVTWVQPQVLTMPQISALKQRLDGWITKVDSAALTLEQESITVVD